MAPPPPRRSKPRCGWPPAGHLSSVLGVLNAGDRLLAQCHSAALLHLLNRSLHLLYLQDVVTFLSWAAEPEMDERKLMGTKWLAVLSLVRAAGWRGLGTLFFWLGVLSLLRWAGSLCWRGAQCCAAALQKLAQRRVPKGAGCATEPESCGRRGRGAWALQSQLLLLSFLLHPLTTVHC